MKFRCERDVLVDALGTASRAVSTRGGVPGLSGVRAQLVGDQLNFTGSDLDLTISVNTTVSGESDGVVVIPARLASDIVRALPPGAVSVAADGDELSISASRSQFSIRLIAGDEFPEPTDVVGSPVTIPGPTLAAALRQVVPAASNDDSRPILTGVLISAEADGLRMVATDSYRLSVCDLPGVSVMEAGGSVLIPSKALSELSRILGDDDVVINLGEREASFAVNDIRLLTRLIEGDFPNYRGLIPEQHPNKLTLSRDELLNALRRVKLLARESTPVRLEMSSDGIELLAITQDVGTAREGLDGTYTGAPLTVAFNPQYLLEGAEASPRDEICLATIDELKPAVITTEGSEDFLYLLMPVRVS